MKNNAIMSIFIGAVIAPACGQWVDLPADPDELRNIIKEVQAESDCEEVMISDYEGAIECSEYANIFDLNEQAEELADLSDDDLEIIKAIQTECGYCFEEARDVYESGDFCMYYDCYNMTDVAYQICEECGILDSIPEDLRGYFDYEAYGRDLDINGRFYYIGDGRYIELYD